MLDPDLLLGLPPIEIEHEIQPRDVMLYALGVGADELSFIYEAGLEALPTMAVALGYPGMIWQDPALDLDWKRVLHAECGISWHAPLPIKGKIRGITTLGPIFDKGKAKGAIVYQTRKIYDEEHRHLATVRGATFLRGDGGFGGSSEGQPKPHQIPSRPPDIVHDLPTSANQAQIYRLSGDLNPLHIDPAVARTAGFSRPILHGLCTLGFAGRSILSVLCHNNPLRMRQLEARFSSPVFPGETIRTEIWKKSETQAAFRSIVMEREVVVLNNGHVAVTD